MGGIFSCHDTRAQTTDAFTDLPYQKRPEPAKCLLADTVTSNYQANSGPEVTLNTSSSSAINHQGSIGLTPDLVPKQSVHQTSDLNYNQPSAAVYAPDIPQPFKREFNSGEQHVRGKRHSARKLRCAPPPPPITKKENGLLSEVLQDVSEIRLSPDDNKCGVNMIIPPTAMATPIRAHTLQGTKLKTTNGNVKENKSSSFLPRRPTKLITKPKKNNANKIPESNSISSIRSSPPTLPRRPPPKPPRSFTLKRGHRLSARDSILLSELPSLDMSIGARFDDPDHQEIYENLSLALRSKRFWQVMNLAKDIITDKMDPQVIMCRLSEKRIITVEDEDEVFSKTHKMAMNQAIIDVLLSKSDEEFDQFCVSLHDDECHHVLADVLDVLNSIFKIIMAAKVKDGKIGPDPDHSSIIVGTNMACDICYFDKITSRSRPVIELDDTKSMRSVNFDSAGSRDELCSSPSPTSSGDRLIPKISVDIFEQTLYSDEISTLAFLLGKYSCISALSIAKIGLDSHATKKLAHALEKNNGLIKLDIRLNPTSNEGVHSLAKALKRNTSLKTLNLSHTNLVSGGAYQLQEMLLHNDVLEELDISFNELDDADCRLLADGIEGNLGLRTLRARNNMINANGCKSIFSSLRRNITVVHIDISGNNIGDNGAAAIAGNLPLITALQELNLEKSNIGAKGALSIAQGLQKNYSMRTLDISINSIGDDGACAFAEMLQMNKTLSSLSMNMCGIGRSGFSSLVDSLEMNKSLQVMKVCFNNLNKQDSCDSLSNSRETSPVSPTNDVPDPLITRVQDILAQRDIRVLLWGNRLEG